MEKERQREKDKGESEGGRERGGGESERERGRERQRHVTKDGEREGERIEKKSRERSRERSREGQRERRAVVVAVDAPLLLGTQHGRLVYSQIVACIASALHWAVLASHRSLVLQKLALGGSTAIIDVSNAILIVFTLPPVRIDADLFYALARLLTVTLVAITMPAREREREGDRDRDRDM